MKVNVGVEGSLPLWLGAHTNRGTSDWPIVDLTGSDSGRRLFRAGFQLYRVSHCDAHNSM